MYTVSEEYQSAICAPTRTDRVTGTLTLTDGTELSLSPANLMSGSLTIDNQCVTGEEIEFGCAYLGQAAFRLKTDLDRYKLYNAVVTLQYELLLPSGTWEAVPLGVFTVAEAERCSVYVSIKAYDNILALQSNYSGVALQGTAYEMLSQLAEGCGLTLGQTEEEILALNPNAEIERQLDSNYDVTTWRDCAAAIAQLLGGFVAADREGRLVIRQFAEASSGELPASVRTEASVSDYACRYIALHIETEAGEYTAATEDEDAEGLAMTISEMPLAESGLAATQQEICDNLFTTLDGIRYTPATVKLTGNPAIELGDRFTLPMPDGTSPETVVTHIVWKYHGGQTLKSVGKNPYLSGTTSRTETTIRKLQSETSANRTVYYSFTNTAAVTVTDDDKEIPAISITYATTQDTSAIFLAQILLDAAPDAAAAEEMPVVYDDDTEGATAHVEMASDAELTMTVRYYLDDILIESFQPKQRLIRGAHTLALFYPFGSLVGGTSGRFSVRLLCEGGTVTIEKNQIKATISGQGLAGGEIWDGTITLEETLSTVTLDTVQLALDTLSEEMAAETKITDTTALSEVLADIAVAKPALAIDGLLDETDVAQIVQSWTFTTESNATYATNYVTTEDGVFALRRQFDYVGTEQEIDSGLMMTLTIDLSPYAETESIEVQ